MNRKLHAVWDKGDTGVNAWLGMGSPVAAEIIATQNFDSVTIDLQHGLNDYPSALACLQAMTASDVTPMARVPWLEPGILMKLLDAGALGIICPMINTPEDAEALVYHSHYSPRGSRSFGPTRAAITYGGGYFKRANETIITLAMIETEQALGNVDKIAATPDLSGLYIGPSDLGLSMGYEPRLDQEEPAIVAAIEKILNTAKKAGIKAGIHCLSPDYARRMQALGFDLVTLGSDIRLLSAAASDAVSSFRA